MLQNSARLTQSGFSGWPGVVSRFTMAVLCSNDSATNGGTDSSSASSCSAAYARVCSFSAPARSPSAPLSPVASHSSRSRAPAATAPPPVVAPAMALSSEDRFSPGTIVSANASIVIVLVCSSS